MPQRLAIMMQIGKERRQSPKIARVQEKTVHPMADGLVRRTIPAADSRQTEGHRLQDGDAEPLIGVWHTKEMTGAQHLDQIVILAEAMEVD